MRFGVLIIISLAIASCSGGSQPNNSANAENVNAKAEKNKQILQANEISNIIRAAQKLENQGRNMDLLRRVPNPNSQRECVTQAEDAQKQIQDLETRINNLSDSAEKNLAPILTDLNECVSCSKTATASCVKSRANINQVIKEQFSQ